MLAEVTFVHQRGMVYGIYWATQNIISSLLNLLGSYETDALGWRWFYWIYAIAIGVGLIIVIFAGFETRFQRPPTALDGEIIVTDEFGVTRTLSGEDAREYLDQLGVQQTGDDANIPKKSYLQMLVPYSSRAEHPFRVMFMSLVHMVASLSSPGILWTILLSSIVLGASIAMSLTYDHVLQGYGWKPKDIGLIGIGGIIGGTVGMAYAGWFSDRFTIWAAKRNNGVHKPEHRLLLLILPGFLAFGSLLLYGFTTTGATWWGPYCGWTLYQITFVTVLIISTTFAAEAWPRNPGPAIVMVVGTKNIVSFGASYGLTPMVNEHGYPWAMGILAGILGAIFLLGIPVYFLNPRWRRYMSKREE